MTAKGYLGFSAALHAVAISLIFILGITDRSADYAVNTVRLRIRSAASLGEPERLAVPSSPTESRRRNWSAGNLPAPPIADDGSAKDTAMSNATENSGTVPEFSSAPMRAPTMAISDTEALFEGLTALDPLDGLDDIQDKQPTHQNNGTWSITWEGSSKRDILGYPPLDETAMPVSSERLVDLKLELTVSPEGSIVAAEVIQPGSGDIRIDRYAVTWALGLVMAPIGEENGTEKGSIRLVFSEVESYAAY